MSRYLLDTSVLIDFSRGAVRVRDRLVELARAHTLGVCGINITEFYSGIRHGAKPTVDVFIDSLVYWDVTRATYLSAGAYRYDFARKGIALASPDTIVAAVARHHQATLLTGNVRHFPMADIVVERLDP